MKCEYCESAIRVVPDNGVCPHCGGLLPLENCCKKAVDIEEYFQKYRSNRVEAIKALRADTDMSLLEAKKMVDQYFDRCLGISHNSEIATARDNLLSAIRGMHKKKR